MSSTRTQIDWEAIERAYRPGVLSLREIAKQHGISEGAIRKRARAKAWARDLTDNVRNQVRTDLVRGTQVRTESEDPDAADRRIVEEAAATIVQIVREHRTDIRRQRQLAQRLSEQLEEAALYRQEIEDAIIAGTAEADDPEATRGARQAAWIKRGQMLRAVALPTHAGVLRDLATALKTLVGLERQAFNIGEQGDDTASGGSAEQPTGLDAVKDRFDAFRVRLQKLAAA